MLRRALRLCCWLLLVPGPAGAEEFLLTLDQSIVAQSNVFKTSPVEVSDASYEITPRFRFLRPSEAFSYDVEYAPSYEGYFATDGINGLDHFLRSRIQYLPTRLDTLRLRANVADYRAVRGSAVDGPTGIPEVVPGELGRVTRVFVYADYERQFTRTTAGTATVGVQYYGYTTPSNVNSTGLVAETGVLHELFPSLSLGGSLRGGYRAYDENGFQPASDNGVVNANLVVRSRPTPTVSFDFEVGPAGVFVSQDQPGAAETDRFFGFENTNGTFGAVFLGCGEVGGVPVLELCPVRGPSAALAGRLDEQVIVDYAAGSRPSGASESLFTFFLKGSLRKEDAWGYVSFDFFRTEDASAGTGFTTIRNSVTFTALYRPTDLWTLRMRVNWNQRNAEGTLYTPLVSAGQSDVALIGPFFFAEANGLIPGYTLARSETTQTFVDCLAARELTDRLSVELGFRYQWQKQVRTDLALDPTFDNFAGTLLFRYAFDSFEY